MDITKIIGLRIKELRDNQNISQKELAFRSDLDRSYIASVESGQRNISIRNIEKIANALNISVKEFFNYDQFNDSE